MSCRMLVAVGKFKVEHVLRDFKSMAMSKNLEKHEKNKNSDYVHDDGWGVVLGKSGKFHEIYKKDVPCWKDPRFRRYYKADVDVVIAHARRATDKGFVDLSHTHPFEKEGWYFCHNGTVSDLLGKDKRDSERFFELLLSNIKAQKDDVKKGITATIKSIKKYTALNFILANKDFVYILVRYKKKPLYYTMKYLEAKNHIIVSSEILPYFKGKWKPMKKDSLIKLDVSNMKLVPIS